MRRFELRHQTGGMPGGPTCEGALFQQHDIADVTACQMVGNRATDDAPADHNDFSSVRE